MCIYMILMYIKTLYGGGGENAAALVKFAGYCHISLLFTKWDESSHNRFILCHRARLCPEHFADRGAA